MQGGWMARGKAAGTIRQGTFTKKAKKAGGIDKKTGKIKPSFISKEKKSRDPLTRKQATLAATYRRMR